MTKNEHCWGEKVSKGRDETRERVWILINLNRCQGIDRQDVSTPSQEISEASCQLNLDRPRHILSPEGGTLLHTHQIYLVNWTWTTQTFLVNWTWTTVRHILDIPCLSCLLKKEHSHTKYTSSHDWCSLFSWDSGRRKIIPKFNRVLERTQKIVINKFQ